jgi:L-iditol 2-dehydrogenase
MIPSLPSPFGHEFSGVVEQIGEGVEGLARGMSVMAANSAPCMRCDYCRAGRHHLCDHLEFLNGAYAEFILVPASIVRVNLHPLPDSMSPFHAALAEPLACVLHGIERSDVRMGQTVCVIGLGPIGLMFVSLATKKGARVIAVGRSPIKLQKALELGAVSAVSMNDLSELEQQVREQTPEHRGADLVIEAVGLPRVWETAMNLVSKGGLVNFFGGCAQGTIAKFDAHRLHYEEKSIISVFHHTPHFIATALRLLREEMLECEALITHRLPLDGLHEAFELMRRQKAIKVAIEFPD